MSKNRLSENPSRIVAVRADETFDTKLKDYMKTGRYCSVSEVLYDALFTMVMNHNVGAPSAMDVLAKSRKDLLQIQ